MSNQILISSGAKLRDLDDVIIGTDGVLSSLGFNVANGVPKLDENGKILVSQLPNSVMEFKGVWDAATNTPTLANGTGNAGDVYLCNVAGTVNFGAGPITFAVGDYAVYTGSVWARSSGATGTVTSVGLSKDGDALAITGSPITTSGTINIGFTGTNLQYINGAGNLVTFPTIATEAQRLITEVYNETGATLAKGTIVYINGGHGNLPTVTKAIATGDPTSAQTYGIVQNDIGNMNNGFVVVSGSLMDLDTQAYPEGTQLYLSGTTAGAWTSTKPYAPVHLVYVAIVTRSHPTQGVVEVSIQNGYEMDELHNVAAQNPDNNDILQYKTSTSLWTKVAGTTTNIAEGSNLYFTDARARAAISLTTTGSTGPATYNSTTGVLNIPNYVDQYVGTVTSVGLSAPTGFSVSGSPVTSSGTLALSFASGYSLPTNVKQSNWDDAYTWVAAFPTQTGNAGKFLTTDGSTLSWATVIAGVQSVTASSPLFSSGGANPNITIQVANTSQNGYLTSTDWNTFNGKQNALTNPVTGTGTIYQIPYFSSTGSTITGSTNIITNAAGSLTFGAANSTTANYFYVNHKDGVDGGFLLRRDNTTEDWQIINASTSGNLDFYSYGIGANVFTLNKTTGTATFRNSIVIGTNPASVSAGLAIGIANDNAIRWRNAANTGNLGMYLSGANKFVFDAGIYVSGDGTFTSPVNVVGAASTKISLYTDYSGGNAGLSIFNSAGTENIILNSANGGIYGTTLVLYDNTNSALLKLRRDAGQQRGALQFGRTNGDVAQIVGDSDTTSLNNGVLSFWTTNGSGSLVDNMWLKGGNLLVGTSTNAGFKLDVYGQARIYQPATNSVNYLNIYNNRSRNAAVLTETTNGGFYAGTSIGTDVFNYQIYDGNAGSARLTIASNGAATFSGSITSNAGDIFATDGTRINFFGVGTGANVGYVGTTTNHALAILTNNSEKARFTSSGDILLGTPTGVSGGGRLQVNGNVNINGVFQINGTTIGGGSGSGVTGSGTTNYIPLWTGSTSLGNSLIKQNDGAEIQIQYSPTQGQLRIGGGNGAGNSRVYIESNGDNSYLDNYGDSTYKNFQIAVKNLKISTGGAHTATFTNSNILSIGSETPNYASRLFVFHNNNNAYNPNGFNGSGLISIQGGNSTSNYTTLRLAGGGSCEFLLGIFQDSGGLANFVFQNYNGSNYGEIMRFAPNRNILIGTTTDNGYKINLNGSISFAYGFLSIFRGSTGANDIFVGNDGSRIYIGGNTYVVGNVTATGGFFDTSDARLKTLVEDNYLLSSIANVKAKLYTKGGRKELGYYAQDLLEILPSAVSEGSDGFLSLSYAQVHTAKISVIEDEVTMLKNRVSELEKQLNLN